MKALVKTAKGPGQMELREVPIPAIGDGDILIKVIAAGICGSDLRTRRLGNSENLRPPVILGHEFAGVIAAVGKNVTLFRAGQRVVSDNSGELCGTCDMCAQGNYMMCQNRVGLGVGRDGGFAEYVKIPGHLLQVNPHTLFEIPDNLSFEEASLMDPLCNAYKAVVEEGKLMPGQDICIFGLGTLGLMCIEVARLAGAAHIIAVNRSDNPLRFAVAKEMGATEILCTEKDDVTDAVRKITGQEMLPLIIDCAGKNELLNLSFTLLQKGGSFIKIGYDASPVDLSLDRFVNKGIRIQGHFAYDYLGWKYCLRLLELGKLKAAPVLSDRIRLEDWESGFEAQEKGKAIKVVFQFEEAGKL